MRSTSRLLLIATFALLISIPAAFAQTPEYSTLPVNEPLLVGSTVLQPGVYLIRVLPSPTGREKIQVTSQDMQKVFATVLTVPHQLKPGEEIKNTTFIYYPASEGMPAALRTWYAPHADASDGGHDIVFEQSRATMLARANHSSVVAYQGEQADLSTAPLSVVTPEATVETYTMPTPPAPVETPTMISSTSSTTTETTEREPVQTAETQPMNMPRTASDLPLLALLGLASVGAAAALRFSRPE